ncbi:EAL domain-containing protein [Ochrobactrum sp. C6C9]|uniref:EAL domain-containing protein n=1 Tax=Ochrobactrum sp. C6C9 TaxID=2736662 RepID=UPI00352FF24C|nr:EAL domain-containing protein [Ochrobactrum sp. C6C9]
MVRRRSSGGSLFNPVPLILLLLLLCGAVAGHWVGEKLRRMGDERQVNAYMEALLSYAGRLIDSAHNTLDQAEQSPYRVCSADERVYLRRILFKAYQIKDIGRLIDGRLNCSTLLPDLARQEPRSTADVLLPDGTYVYADRPLVTPGTYGPVMGKGNSNVVLSPAAFDFMHTPGYAFALFMSDQSRENFARFYEYPANADLEPLSGGRIRDFVEKHDQLNAYACEPDKLICLALRTEIDRTSLHARLRSFLSIVLGMLAAGSLGLGWRVYNNRDRSLMTLLSRALTKKELEVVYQPVVNAVSGAIVGFEALIRWEIHKGDFVPPDVFITRAEKSGLIHRITLYVIDAVISEMGELLRAKPGLRININISARDLHDMEFANRLEARLVKASIDPQQIGLELTERTAVDFAKASGAIHHLREKGHRIYIDDFGTGYSSLAYLGALNVDAIKIDKTFTRTVDNGSTVSIVPQILAMARQHCLDVVVEGVETEAQALYFARESAGDSAPVKAQGWYFGKPVSAIIARTLVVAKPAKPVKRRKTTRKGSFLGIGGEPRG